MPFGWGADARAAQQRRDRLLEAGDARHLQGLHGLRLRLDSDVGRAAEPRAAASACSPSWTATGPSSTRPAASRARATTACTNVGKWLRDNKVVDTDNRVLVGLAFAFLAVCLINTVGLLLAKFLNGAADQRRAPRTRRQPPPDLHAAPDRGRRAVGAGRAARHGTRGARAGRRARTCTPSAHLSIAAATRSSCTSTHRRHLGGGAGARRHARCRAVPGLAHRAAAAGAVPEESVRERP